MRTAIALVGLTLIAACGDGAVARADPAGSYVRTSPSPGRLILAPTGANRWRLSLSAGGRPDGAATGADCQFEAEGSLHGDVLRAQRVEIRLTEGAARVSTDYQGCGVGVNLNGTYQRVTVDQLAVGDGLARARAAYPDSRLQIAEGYPWARFVVLRDERPVATLTFDGENEELADGSNSFQRIGDIIDWSALKPGLKITRIEGARP